jgi:hypothetical protein
VPLAKSTHPQPTSTGITQSAPSSSSNTSGSGDFFGRFVDKISSAFKTSSVDASKRSPKSNAYAMNASYSDVEQGSKSGYSFYEIADEILPSNPVHTISQQEIPSLTPERSLVKNAEFGYISKGDRVHLAQADTSATPAVPAAPSFPTDASKNIAPAPSQPAAPAATAPAVSAPVVSNTPAQPVTTPTTVIAAPVMESKVVPQAPELPSSTPVQQPVVSTPVVPSVSSAPLTVVPSTPSVSDIKEKSQQQPEPQLKDTPKIPEEFKSQTSEPVKMEEPKKEEPVIEKPKPKKKAVKKIKLPKEESRDPVAQNPNSQTIYMMNGKKVTTGFLDNPRQ